MEDKLGQEYEPYIFAALNSSKVMLSIGTKPEYFNAVWVKNEWSRYIKLMKNDRSRLLIPCYKDMDAYDLPEEFSHLQAQDMGKIGFINDVVRGINKVLKKDEPQPTVQVVQQTTQVSANVENLLKRGNLALEDKKWAEADGFFEQVLNENVEEPRAYLGKLLAEYKVSNEKQLENCNADFSNSNNYKKLEEIYKQSAYNQAVDLMNKAKNDLIFIQAKEMFVSLKGFKDSENKAQECEEKALEYLYNQALNSMKNAGNEVQYRKVKSQFLSIKNYKDSERKAEECEEKALECEEKKLNDLYEKALQELKNAHTETGFLSAKEKFKKLGDYRDSKNKVRECDELIQAEKTELLYIKAGNLQSTNNIKQIEEAITIYKQIINYKDSKQQIENCSRKIEEITQKAEQEEQERERLNKLAEKERKRRTKRNKMIAIIASSSVAIGIAAVVLVTNVVIPNMNYNYAMDLYNFGKYKEAITAFEAMDGYKNSDEMILENKYLLAMDLYNNSQYEKSCELFSDLKNYKKSSEYISQKNMRPYCKVGDIITFGKYEWYVISKSDACCQLLSKDIVAKRTFNVELEEITWSKCTLRSWLNNDFYNEFSEDEKSMILSTNLNTEEYDEHDDCIKFYTDDYIYLLSIDEAEKISAEMREASASWWLRSDGHMWCNKSIIIMNGDINSNGSGVSSELGVRPVINIKFK